MNFTTFSWAKEDISRRCRSLKTHGFQTFLHLETSVSRPLPGSNPLPDLYVLVAGVGFEPTTWWL